MKVIYRPEARPNQATSSESNPVPVVIPAPAPVNNVEVSWEVNTEAHSYITAAVLTVPNAPMHRTDSGAISADYPDYRDAIFASASYIADFVLAEMGADALSPGDVLSRRPMVEPETDEERRAMGENALSGTASASASMRASISAAFKPSACASGAGNEVAWAHYAAGLRSDAPFVKYEEFYKVLEHRFPGKEGQEFDRAVSASAQPLDAQFTPAAVKSVRELRIRITHPHPRASVGPHLSPHRLGDLKTGLMLYHIFSRLPG